MKRDMGRCLIEFLFAQKLSYKVCDVFIHFLLNDATDIGKISSDW